MENKDLKTVSPAELSEITGIPLRTLAGWRNTGAGPSYIKAEGRNGAIRYFINDVKEWMLKNRHNPSDK